MEQQHVRWWRAMCVLMTRHGPIPLGALASNCLGRGLPACSSFGWHARMPCGTLVRRSPTFCVTAHFALSSHGACVAWFDDEARSTCHAWLSVHADKIANCGTHRLQVAAHQRNRRQACCTALDVQLSNRGHHRLMAGVARCNIAWLGAGTGWSISSYAPARRQRSPETHAISPGPPGPLSPFKAATHTHAYHGGAPRRPSGGGRRTWRTARCHDRSSG
jgi:hypothetical protein